MYLTVILILLLIICLFASRRKGYRGLRPFDKDTTLPLRGMLALLIVTYHIGLVTDTIISQFASSKSLGYVTVAIFFFISGYGLCASYLAKGHTYTDGFIKNRIGKLFPKFITLTVAMILAYHFLSPMDFGEQIYRFQTGHPPLPNSWFIYAIIYIYFSFYVIAITIESPKFIGLMLTLAIALYFWLTSMAFPNRIWWYVTIISVSLGYFVALYEKKITKLFSHGAALYLTLIAILLLSLYASKQTTRWYFSLLCLEICILVWSFSIYVIIRTLGFMQWRWLCKAGVISLDIYLVHGIIIMAGKQIGLENMSLWIFTYAITVPSSILVYKVFKLFSSPVQILRS